MIRQVPSCWCFANKDDDDYTLFTLSEELRINAHWCIRQ